MILEQRTCYIQSGKQKSVDLAAAIGGSMEQAPTRLKDGTTPCFVGVHPSTIPLLRQAHLAERPFVTGGRYA